MPKDTVAESEMEDLFEMEDIIQFKREHNTDYYLIKWVGYEIQDATWEPRKNIVDPDESQKKKMSELKAKWFEEHGDEQVDSSGTKRKRKTNESKASFDSHKNIHNNTNEDRKIVNLKEERIYEENNINRISMNSNGITKHEEEDGDSKNNMFTENNNNMNTNNNINNNNINNNNINNNVTRVIHIRQKEQTLQVLMNLPSKTSADEYNKLWINIEEARNKYSQELLDYLLARLRFKQRT